MFFSQKFKQCLAASALMLTSVMQANAAVTYTFENGNLKSAQGISVGSNLYDVEFLDGTFNDLFPDVTSLPTATNVNELLSFGDALLDQVFLDGPSGLLDSTPSLTYGCEFVSYCEMIIPVVINPSVNFVFAYNSATDTTFVDFQSQVGDFAVNNLNIARDYPTDQFNYRTFAKFSQQSVSPVHEAPNLVLLAVGSLMLLGMSRRGKA